MTTSAELNFDKFSEAVLRVKSERDALLEACRAVSASADADYRIDLANITHAIHKVRDAIKFAERA